MCINNLISYFIIYSFFGWALESLYKTILQKKAINSGFLYGPFCPIYGFGALIMLLCLEHFIDNITLLFIVSFFILSLWEYIVGILLEKIFKTKYWDYSNNKFNIKGRVCLLNSCFWGILGVIFTLVVHPPINSIINSVQKNLLVYTNIILFSIMLIDCIFTVIRVYNINVNIKLLNDITKNIKQELDKIKQYAGNKANASETLQHFIEELKEKQEIIKTKLEKQTARLRKAFPTMKHLKISEFVNKRKKATKKDK